MNTTVNPQEPNLSVYQNEEAMDDFPVLKAFQQYIDAEQAKARKRMTVLSIVFGVLLISIVAIFLMRLNDVGRRNQEIYDRLAERNQQLNDRLVEYAMKDRGTAGSSADSSAALKTMTETITALQKQLLEQQVAAAKAAAENEKKAASPSPEAIELARKNREEALRLKRAAEQLKAEKAKLKAEKERQRQEEIERQRRRLYPAYYAKKDAEAKKAANATEGLLQDIEDELDAVKEDDLSDDDAIEYFESDETEYKIPVEIKGKSAGWRIPKE